jgi:hypothetical protein
MRRCIMCSAIVMICLAPAVTAADPPTAVRVFNLHYTSVAEASTAVQPLLSENGSSPGSRAHRCDIKSRSNCSRGPTESFRAIFESRSTVE